MEHSSSEAFQQGEKVRRAVLGDAYVDAALARGQSEYTRPLQEFITANAWGTVWTRPELERRDRSMINIAFLTALKAWPELKIHTQGALRNGLTEVQIREVVMQAMIYCGFPAGIEAMKVTEAAINEMVEKGEHVRQIGKTS